MVRVWAYFNTHHAITVFPWLSPQGAPQSVAEPEIFLWGGQDGYVKFWGGNVLLENTGVFRTPKPHTHTIFGMQVMVEKIKSFSVYLTFFLFLQVE